MQRGDLKQVWVLIRGGVQVNEQLLEIEEGHRNVVFALLKAAASCKGLPKDQMNDLLHLACHKGDEFVVKELITPPPPHCR